MNRIVFFLLIIVVAPAGYGQTAFSNEEGVVLDTGVARHSGLDDIYRRFSKAYGDLDAEVFRSIYTKNAAYLVPGANIDIGNDSIVKGFASFFSSVKSNNARIVISFRIVQRKVEGNIGYDVGIYTLRTIKDGKEINAGQGKFVVVAVREGKNWKFQVDGYSELPQQKNAQ